KMSDEAVYDQYKFDSYKMLVPGENGWIFRSENDLRNDFRIDSEALNNLENLAAAYKTRGIDLVMLLVPTRGLIHADQLRPEDQKKYGFTNVDAIWNNYGAAVKSLEDRGIHVISIDRTAAGSDFFYKRDHHWNAKGAKIAAETVAAYIKKMPAYNDIAKVTYSTLDVEPLDYYGVSKKVFSKLCHTTQPPEPIQKKQTDRVDEANGGDALFGDASVPDIVLLGTSNSTPEPSFSNFEGALKEALSADVLNMSVSGGGLETAMLSYLNSDYIKKHPAKIAIWEIPGYYNISTYKTFFREAIPAVYGDCGDKAVAEAKDFALDEKISIPLDSLSGEKIAGSDYYLYLNFAKPIAQSFSVSLQYKKDRERYKFQRDARYPRDGEFYLNLAKGKSSPLQKVVLSVGEKAVGTHVDVKICKKSEIQSAGMEPKGMRGVFRKLFDKL
ncbi:MAG TPA: alginate O-acetyltransferase, partial [Micavibrio sp.]